MQAKIAAGKVAENKEIKAKISGEVVRGDAATSRGFKIESNFTYAEQRSRHDVDGGGGRRALCVVRCALCRILRETRLRRV